MWFISPWIAKKNGVPGLETVNLFWSGLLWSPWEGGGRATATSLGKWKSQPCFFTKSVKFGFGELSICRICAESRDLQSGHGFRACSFKNKRKKLNFHEKMKVATLFCHQVGQIWSYRAVIFFPCSKSRDLGPEHGFRACSFKNEREKLDVHIWGCKNVPDLVLSPSRSDLVVQSSRYFFRECSPRDLAFGQGFRACSLKNKRENRIFIFVGVKKQKHN